MRRSNLIILVFLALLPLQAHAQDQIDVPVIYAATAPTVDGLSQYQGGDGARLTITGRNFRNVIAVYIGAPSTSFTVDSPTQITTIVPEIPNLVRGNVSVWVVTGSGTGTSQR